MDETTSSADLDSSITTKEIPYGTEYAKSGRAKCKGCKEPIEKGALRMAVRFQSKFFDGMQENWHHYECFWKKARKNDINEASIRGMDWLKWEDQELIRQRINELKASGGSGYTPKTAAVKVEKAKSASGKCFICKEKIEKNELRIASRASFYHINCFTKSNLPQKSTKEFDGYDQLDDDDKAQLDRIFSNTDTSEKKRKLEYDNSEMAHFETPVAKKGKIQDQNATREALKEQSEILWNTRKALKGSLNAEEMETLLKLNGNYKSKKGGVERMLDKLVDMVVFGAPEPCTECGTGTLNYSTDIHAYRCSGSGNKSEDAAKCAYTVKNPKRMEFKIPKGLKKNNDYMKNLKSPLLPARIYPSGLENVSHSEPEATSSKQH